MDGHDPRKSGKQRRAEIKAKRVQREADRPRLRGDEDRKEIPTGTAPCNPENLAPYNSYGQPEFVQRGYYKDILFRCAHCPKQEVWTATRQKWWYEVAKGSVGSTARLCHPCRRAEQARKAEARRVHLEGVAGKLPIPPAPLPDFAPPASGYPAPGRGESS